MHCTTVLRQLLFFQLKIIENVHSAHLSVANNWKSLCPVEDYNDDGIVMSNKKINYSINEIYNI